MTKRLVIQDSFNAGELSPRLYGQVQFNKYDNALETCINAITQPHGPVARRNGTKYINEVKDSSNAVRLLKFQFSADEAYIIEAGNQYMRFYQSTGAVVATTDVTNGTFTSGITSWTDQSNGTGSIAHDAGNGRMNLVGGGAGNEAIAEQSLTLEQGPWELNLDVFTGDVTVKIGTSSGGTQLKNETVSAGTGNTVSFTNTALQTVYITLENAASATHAVDNISLTNLAYELATPYTTAQVPNIQYKQFGNKLYIVHPDVAPRILTRAGAANWTIEQFFAFPPPTVESGYAPATTVTPAAATGTGVTFTAGSGVFLAADVGRQIINLNGNGRASITAYSSATAVTCDIIEDFDSTSAIASGDWKMDLSPIADLTVDGTKVGSIVTIDADQLASTTAIDTFRSADIGKYLLINNGVIEITQVPSANQAKGEVLKSLTSLDETDIWSLESDAWNATDGYPRSIGLFDQRLVFGGNATYPQRIWVSEAGLFDGFGVGSLDGDSIEIDISSSQANRIEWMATSRDLLVGTSGSELTITSGTSGPITPSTVQQRASTYYGSDLQQPITVGSEILFIQQAGRKIRTMRYDFGQDSYIGEDLLFLSEHLTSGTNHDIKEMAFAQEPDTSIYAVRNDGVLLCGIYNRDQEVIGWSRFTTDGTFENVETITTGGTSQVWTVVNRTVNSSTVRYIELFDDGIGESETDRFSDCSLVYSDPKTITGITKANPAVVTANSHGYSNGDSIKIKNVVGMTEVNNKTYTVANATTNTFELSGINSSSYTTYESGGEAHKTVTTITGLSHLEGKTVQIKTDNAAHPDKTVSSGSITLDAAATEVVVGLSYTTSIKTLKKEFDIGMGSMQGQRSRFIRPILRVYKSVIPELNGNFIPARKPSDAMDLAVPLYSGDLEYGPTSWSNTGQVTITLSSPFPLMINGLFGSIDGGVK